MVPSSHQFEALDRERQVHRADVLFDSNVFRANDDESEKKLHALANLLIAHPGQGDFWFSLMSLSELIASSSRERRIELLKRFRNFYLKLRDRVKFMQSLEANVRAECTGSKMIPSSSASDVDDDIVKSIVAGDLVGLLKEAHEDWRSEKTRLRKKYEERCKEYQKHYAEKAEFRSEFAQSIQTYFSTKGLFWCDNLARQIITSYGASPSLTLDEVKARPLDYPCIWTFSLLARLAQYAQTITEDERRKKFPAFDDVLTPHPNDFIDADIAGTGAHCGMMITNDRPLIAKLNRLYDANLIWMQGFTVSDALVAYIPPNGRTRAASG